MTVVKHRWGCPER